MLRLRARARPRVVVKGEGEGEGQVRDLREQQRVIVCAIRDQELLARSDRVARDDRVPTRRHAPRRRAAAARRATHRRGCMPLRVGVGVRWRGVVEKVCHRHLDRQKQ